MSSQLNSDVSASLKSGVLEPSQSSLGPDVSLSSQPAQREESPSTYGRKGYTKSFCILLFLSLKRALDYLRSDFGLKIISANSELYRKFKLRYRHELELLSQIMAVS